MKDAVNTVLSERQGLEGGFGGSLLLSAFGHGFLLAGILIVSLLPAPTPKMDVFAFAAPLPRGGGGNPAPPAPAPAVPEAPKAEPKPEPAAAQPPPQILKPPQEHPSRALPDPNLKKPPKAEKAPPTRTVVPPDAGVSRTTAGATAATGTSSQPQGLDLTLPPGLGTPTGLASGGDFYLASVQQRIWSIWMQQVRAEQSQSVSVAFTILADGSVTDVQITQTSGVALLDLAAKRAIMTASPFRPLPKTYGTDRITIQANFKQTSS
jgi:protein TonB